MSICRRAARACLALASAALIAPTALATDVQTVPIRQDGTVGELHYVSGAKRQTTVIMLNGSDGGIPCGKDADDLACSGYTVLSLAYSKIGAVSLTAFLLRFGKSLSNISTKRSIG